MKNITILLITLLLLTGCTPSPHPKDHPISLEDEDWQPVNQNYVKSDHLNQKDF